MKKLLIIGLVMLWGLSGCEDENAIKTYNSPDNVYFNFDDEYTNDRDSIFYTFAFTPEVVKDTVFLPVIVSGDRVSFDRNFKIQVTEEGTTAQAGTHYEPLKDEYVIPADSGSLDMPFIMYSNDPLLKDQSVAINLILVPSADFDTLFADLIRARILFSNRLEKPEWWDYWQTTLLDYTRTKHQLYLIAVGGRKDLISSSEEAINVPRSLFLIDQLRRLLADPLSWVEQHASEYAVEPVNDMTYHFYSVSNPNNVFTLKLNEDDGKYVFIDENEGRVTIN